MSPITEAGARVRLPVAGVAPGIRDFLHSQAEFELREEAADWGLVHRSARHPRSRLQNDPG
ncbi:MAG: hypothetical protein M3P18_16435 [Actinomycetota bacterium]|nr:hypothetical protein [Actinomycetota bacterium]